MELLSRRSFTELARKYGVTKEEIQEIARFIAENLNPYPARTHWGNPKSGSNSNRDYQIPDIIISEVKNQNSRLLIEIISPYAGQLRINPLFRQALKEAPPGKVDQWNTDFEQANLLIKCLKQRDNTLVRFMNLIVKVQRDFIINGDHHLVPITRASIA